MVFIFLQKLRTFAHIFLSRLSLAVLHRRRCCFRIVIDWKESDEKQWCYDNNGFSFVIVCFVFYSEYLSTDTSSYKLIYNFPMPCSGYFQIFIQVFTCRKGSVNRIVCLTSNGRKATTGRKEGKQPQAAQLCLYWVLKPSALGHFLLDVSLAQNRR